MEGVVASCSETAKRALWKTQGLGNRAASAVVGVDGVFVLGYTGGETLGVESLASICKMWV